MRVDLWSDLVCPWCAISKGHLDQALLAFEHGDEVTVLWRSFELDPGAPAVRDGSYSSQLASRYSTSPRGGSAMVGRISAAAERAGVQARFDLARPANTFDAHRMLHLAKEHGVQDRLASRLTRAYLAEGELLSDHVRADEAAAARLGISAVPTLLIDERHIIPGAQSPESMLATLRRAWSRQGERPGCRSTRASRRRAATGRHVGAEQPGSHAQRLAHRQIGRPGVGQVVDGQPELDRARRREHHVACAVQRGVDAEHLAGVGGRPVHRVVASWHPTRRAGLGQWVAALFDGGARLGAGPASQETPRRTGSVP